MSLACLDSPPVAANHDILRRDLRKAKANLEEERRRKSAALYGREALKAEALAALGTLGSPGT